MFTIDSDQTIHATRGDVVCFAVAADGTGGERYLFREGDVVRICVSARKNCKNVLLCRDFPVFADTYQVIIALSESDTRLGAVISKPTDYWYEIELNPHTSPQTILGYDGDGAKIFRLYPEGAAAEEA